MFRIHFRGVISILPMARHNGTAPDMVLGAPHRAMSETTSSIQGARCPNTLFFNLDGA